jgi:hypothetical protein
MEFPHSGGTSPVLPGLLFLSAIVDRTRRKHPGTASFRFRLFAFVSGFRFSPDGIPPTGERLCGHESVSSLSVRRSYSYIYSYSHSYSYSLGCTMHSGCGTGRTGRTTTNLRAKEPSGNFFSGSHRVLRVVLQGISISIIRFLSCSALVGPVPGHRNEGTSGI